MQPSDVNLSNCDREPIHQLGAIQNFGALIAVNSDWFVAHCSTNLEKILGPGRTLAAQIKGPGAKLASQVKQVGEKQEG